MSVIVKNAKGRATFVTFCQGDGTCRDQKSPEKLAQKCSRKQGSQRCADQRTGQPRCDQQNAQGRNQFAAREVRQHGSPCGKQKEDQIDALRAQLRHARVQRQINDQKSAAADAQARKHGDGKGCDDIE